MKSRSTFVKVIESYGTVTYDPGFFGDDEADHFLSTLIAGTPWSQDSIRLFGRHVLQPRLTCWMGDPGAVYKYSGLIMRPTPWSESVARIKARIERELDVSFNSALLNYYRDGRDSMGWHRDNEKELGPEPLIASVSFGAGRRFEFRHYKTKEQRMSLDLRHGSVLIMGGLFQEYWEHSLPKTPKKTAAHIAPRVNITFREVLIP